MHKQCPLAIALLALFATARAAPGGEDWPQFRGPTQQGWAESSHPPTTWSETQNIAWKMLIPGLGWSSPVILDKQIWMTTATDDGKSLRAVCVDQDSGKITRDVEVFAEIALDPKNTFNSYASPTPALEHGRVYVTFGNYGSACLDAASGAILWKNSDLRLDHKEGPGSSPIIWGNDFILHCDGTDVQYVAVLNKFNGQIAFKIQRSYPLKTLEFDLRKAYSTPTVASIDGKEQLISLGSRRVYGYDPVDGKELWHCDIPGFSNVPRPVIGDGMVFVSTGFQNAELWAIKPQAAGADGVAPIVWKCLRGCPLKPSVLFVNDQVYFVSDSGIGRCLDARTGRQLWQSRILAACTASPVYAGGYIYFFDEHGKCAVLRPGPTLDEVSENQLDGRILASPAVVGDAMFVRTDGALYRIEKGQTRMTKPESPNQ